MLVELVISLISSVKSIMPFYIENLRYFLHQLRLRILFETFGYFLID